MQCVTQHRKAKLLLLSQRFWLAPPRLRHVSQRFWLGLPRLRHVSQRFWLAPPRLRHVSQRFWLAPPRLRHVSQRFWLTPPRLRRVNQRFWADTVPSQCQQIRPNPRTTAPVSRHFPTPARPDQTPRPRLRGQFDVRWRSVCAWGKKTTNPETVHCRYSRRFLSEKPTLNRSAAAHASENRSPIASQIRAAKLCENHTSPVSTSVNVCREIFARSATSYPLNPYRSRHRRITFPIAPFSRCS